VAKVAPGKIAAIPTEVAWMRQFPGYMRLTPFIVNPKENPDILLGVAKLETM
jgi:hypothetical protein